MFISVSTMFGPRLAHEPARFTIPTDPAAAMRFASDLDRQAGFDLSEGRVEQADRKAHLAHEARCRAAGGDR